MGSAAAARVIPPDGAAGVAEVPAAAALPEPVLQTDYRYARADLKVRLLVQRFVLPAVTFLAVLLVWQSLHRYVAPELPPPAETWAHAQDIFADPFYDAGPNDKGIGWQLLYSLGRVLAGFGLAVAVGVPVGLLMGMSQSLRRAWEPLVNILRPVSPLAWLPIGLLVFKAVDPSAIFVIFITCIWPTLINTAAGVRAIPQDYMNVARVLRLSRWETARRILLPSIVPHMITGMRLSLGIAWMVIVAAEMLTGGIGIGFYVWDEWNNLNVNSIIVAIVLIGLVGILLESLMQAVQNRLDYNR
jgi:nitrate/nitrite transport system permease protein